MSDVKKLDFSKFQSKYASDEELNKALEYKGGDRGKFFKPGLYELEISGVKFKEDDAGNPVFAKDPSWVLVEYTFKGVDSEKTIRNTMTVPLKNEWFMAPGSTKPNTFAYSKFKDFCYAIGVPVTRDSIPVVLIKYFTNPKVQIGMRIKATIGYVAAHSTMARKPNEEGGLLLKLVDASGKDMLNDKGEPITAVNDEQLKLFCKSQTPEIKFNGFTNIIKMEPSDHPVAAKVEAEEPSIFDE